MSTNPTVHGLPPGSLVLCGATGSGKSEVALEIAVHQHLEIVSVDSMQVYRGLDIGTAKPSAAERRRIPHHGIDLVEPTESFSAADYLAALQPVLSEAARKGIGLLCCGGTGLYLNALLYGLNGAPAPDPGLRARLEALSLADLLQELQQTAPESLKHLDIQNPRRVVRALEKALLQDQAEPGARAGWNEGTEPGVPVFALRRDPADLRARIEARVDAMFAAGLVAETQVLLERGQALNRTALQAIGYRQVVEHLRGLRSLAETVLLVKQKTWQLARRQSTWFRRQVRATWVDVPALEPPSETAQRIWNLRPAT